MKACADAIVNETSKILYTYATGWRYYICQLWVRIGVVVGAGPEETPLVTIIRGQFVYPGQ